MYYEQHDEIDKAIASLENTLRVDAKEFPSSAFAHASLMSKKSNDAGDYEGAVQVFQDNLKYASFQRDLEHFMDEHFGCGKVDSRQREDPPPVGLYYQGRYGASGNWKRRVQ